MTERKLKVKENSIRIQVAMFLGFYRTDHHDSCTSINGFDLLTTIDVDLDLALALGMGFPSPSELLHFEPRSRTGYRVII